jgi:hypothetical protein
MFSGSFDGRIKPSVWVGAFGVPYTADTREEAVFWAERWASKNGGEFERPPGWEGIAGAPLEDP